MFTDDILKYQYSGSFVEYDSRLNRKNPFSNDSDNNEQLSISAPRDILHRSINNDMISSQAHYGHKNSVEELTDAVKECKLSILSICDENQTKAKLIERLVELNELLYSAKETKTHSIGTRSLNFALYDTLNVAGHFLVKYRLKFGSARRCEVCHVTVRTPRTLYHCVHCIVHVHDSPRCRQGLHRVCPAYNDIKLSLLPSQLITRKQFSSADNHHHITIDSYPITGSLTSQRFLCAECSRVLKAVSHTTDLDDDGRSMPKFCHYYRQFYCSDCHWGDRFFIPAVYFMLNKWKAMSVCRSAYIHLTYMWDKALFRMPIFWVQNYSSVANVTVIRRKLFSLRLFINKCAILKKICGSSAEWVIDQPYLVTMKFVEGICSGTSLDAVQVLFSNIVSHIPQCEECKSLCMPCHLCADPDKLYVMSRTVWTCTVCFVTCIHEHCALTLYNDKSEYICPNCSKI